MIGSQNWQDGARFASRPPALASLDAEAWDDLLAELDFAFQPIVNSATGQCFGYEALLRNHEGLGYPTAQDLFDACHQSDILEEAQVSLWDKAVSRFAALPEGQGARLFLNMDPRSLALDASMPSRIRGLLQFYGLQESAVTLEVAGAPLTEHPGERLAEVDWVTPFKRIGCKLALDRFGGSEAGAWLLHRAEPDFVKIDRFFIQGVASDARKKLLLSQMVSIAHLLGILVVAVGVETEREFMVCREVGCDLMQGYLVAEPSLSLETLPARFPYVEELSQRDRRHKTSDQKIILDQMEDIPALPVQSEIMQVFERLRDDTRQTFVPIIDQLGQPLGIVREASVKSIAYSPFGKALISNKGLGRKLRDFIVRCPIADLHTPVENIMSIYSGDEQAEGIMLVDQMRYVGFLSARSIIRVINEKNLAQARDQNPLSKLPGNALINDFVNQSLAETGQRFVFVYVDFDNFKPFNDKYGFRLGDRAILLFAELMRKHWPGDRFLGHIGGDDFFVGIKGLSLAEAEAEVSAALEEFRSNAESFYDAEARERGNITALDREGNPKTFPLLSASAALVEVPLGHEAASVDDVSAVIAKIKKPAKLSPTKMASASL